MFKFRTMRVDPDAPTDKLVLTARNDSRVFPLVLGSEDEHG